VLTADGRVAALRLDKSVKTSLLRDGTVSLDELATAARERTNVRGRWLQDVWEYIVHLPAMLTEDIPALGAALSQETPAGAVRIGDHGRFFV
jgi:hypothetical protein